MFSQYEPVKTPETADVLHHMEVFHCDSADPDEAFPLWSGPCGDPSAPEKLSRCKKVLAAWAIGAGPFTYPEEAGLAVGGPGFDPHVMLEVHYNNEGKRAGMVDHSGMRFTLTDELRAYDAGILELGLTYVDTMAIPPGVEKFPLSGSCLGQCTNQVIWGVPECLRIPALMLRLFNCFLLRHEFMKFTDMRRRILSSRCNS